MGSRSAGFPIERDMSVRARRCTLVILLLVVLVVSFSAFAQAPKEKQEDGRTKITVAVIGAISAIAAAIVSAIAAYYSAKKGKAKALDEHLQELSHHLAALLADSNKSAGVISALAPKIVSVLAIEWQTALKLDGALQNARRNARIVTLAENPDIPITAAVDFAQAEVTKAKRDLVPGGKRGRRKKP